MVHYAEKLIDKFVTTFALVNLWLDTTEPIKVAIIFTSASVHFCGTTKNTFTDKQKSMYNIPPSRYDIAYVHSMRLGWVCRSVCLISIHKDFVHRFEGPK